MRRAFLLSIVLSAACGRFGSAEETKDTPPDGGAPGSDAAIVSPLDAGPAGKPIETLATNVIGAYGIAVDATGVYVASPSDDGSRSVFKIPPSGGPAVLLASTKKRCGELTLDADNVYFACNDGLFSIPKSGGQIKTLSASPMTAVASVGGFVYACRFELNDPRDVVRIDKANGTPTTIAADIPHCESFAVAGTDVYFGGDVIHHVLGPDSTEQIDQRIARRVVADADFIYSLDYTRPVVQRVTHAKMVVEDLATTPGNKAVETGDLAQDETHIYWELGTTDGQVLRARKDQTGGEVEVIADHLVNPSGLAVDAQYVYWTERDIGTVKRRLK